jgi:hypothetical protein
VIDVDVHLEPALDLAIAPPLPVAAELRININGSDGFHDEYTMVMQLQRGRGCCRFDIVQPHRWWPAGMGGQTLYELHATLVADRMHWTRSITVGLTSVRLAGEDGPTALLVNGQVCNIKSIVAVDRIDEKRMLAVAGNSLMVVRDHYGTDVLYDAADRAGILMLQCVPIHPSATPETDVAEHVERLMRHPSLAGWYVGHLGTVSERMTDFLHRLDPIHSVFHDVPGYEAA